jgi:modulator of FtsH protease
MEELGTATLQPASQTAGTRQAVFRKVLGLLSFSFAFTAAGAYVGMAGGAAAVGLGLLGGFVSFLSLLGLRRVSPLNIILLYVFSTFEGMTLASVLARAFQRGAGGAVLAAMLGTAVILVAAGGYGAVTRRDLSSLGAGLSFGLFAFILALLGGLVLQLPALTTFLSAAGAVLFTGFVVYDMNAAATAAPKDADDAVLLTLNIYLDLLNLFLLLLQILSGDDD